MAHTNGGAVFHFEDSVEFIKKKTLELAQVYSAGRQTRLKIVVPYLITQI